MEKILLNKKDTVAIITMNNIENRHDIVFAREFLKAIDEANKDKNAKALVISSNDKKNFSQGIDVDWIKSNLHLKNFQVIIDFLHTMNEVFKRLIFSDFPTIAQINGHAFGNGALLACACDFRFMQEDRGFFCFPEVDIGIPFLPSMIAYSKKAINYQYYQEIVFTGKRCIAKELLNYGVILKSAKDSNELENITLSFAKTFNKPRNIYKKLKERIFADILAAFDKDKDIIDNLDIFAE